MAKLDRKPRRNVQYKDLCKKKAPNLTYLPKSGSPLYDELD